MHANPPHELRERPGRDLALLLLLGALLFLPGLGARDLGNPDEPRYAEVAREMLLFGDGHHLLVPHLNGELYSHKPPLLFWSIVLFSKLRGTTDEIAARLPSALAAIFTLPLIFAIARRWFPRRAAWLAVIVFGSCVNIMLQARTAQIDILLGFWVTLAVYGWVRGETERRPGFVLLFWAAAGMATLAKGPVGLLPPLLSIVTYLLLTGRRDRLAGLRPLAGFAIYSLVVAAWLVPAALAGGEDYWRPLLLKQNLERFANPWGHIRPWYYYLQILPTNFFPWIFVLPSCIVLGWRRFRGSERDGYRFALSWAVVTVLFFSLSAGKRTVYILTMYPAMALLIGAGLDRLARDREGGRHWLTWPVGLLAALLTTLCGIAVALTVDPSLAAGRPEIEALGQRFPQLVALTFGLFAAATIGGWALLLRRRFTHGIAALALGSAVAGSLAVFAIQPRFDVFKSARPLAEVYLAHAGDEPYAIYPRLDPPFLFYTRRFATVLRTEEELRAYAAREAAVWIFAERSYLVGLDPPLALHAVAHDRDPLTGYVLLGSDPFPGRDK